MDLEYIYLPNVKLKSRYMHFHYFTLYRGVLLIKAQRTIILFTSHSLISQSDGRDGAFWPTVHKCVALLREVLVFSEIFVDSTQYKRQFLGALAKLRKAANGFVMSVRPSVRPPSVCPLIRMEQLGSHWTDFHEILFEIFWKIRR